MILYKCNRCGKNIPDDDIPSQTVWFDLNGYTDRICLTFDEDLVDNIHFCDECLFKLQNLCKKWGGVKDEMPSMQ